eukprot:4783824-Pyramimonas_sp.AAC.1
MAHGTVGSLQRGSKSAMAPVGWQRREQRHGKILVGGVGWHVVPCANTPGLPALRFHPNMFMLCVRRPR